MELKQFIDHYIERGDSRFHMPGHKGNAPLLAVSDLQRYDLTEIAGADSLYEADGILRKLEERAARLYGAADTLLSAGGSTLCIQTMLAAAFGPGDTVLAVRNVHAAFLNACTLLRLNPVWIYPEAVDSSGVSGAAAPWQIKEALAAHPKAKGVYLTTPDYLGTMTDIAAIAAICHAKGLPLLVDNAHGAALRFLPPDRHPMTLGADLCCDSAHKTLPVLTGGAFLHSGGRYGRKLLKERMALFGSTSPSYLILLSIDLCLDYLEGEGRKEYLETAEAVERLRGFCAANGVPVLHGGDPLKLSVGTGLLGYSDTDAGTHFRGRRIEPEYIGGGYTVLMASPFNTESDWERLKTAVFTLKPKPALKADPVSFRPSPVLMPLWQAAFADAEEVSPADAVGRIAARTVIACPPGVPVAVPGEEITPNVEKILKNSGILSVKVVK